MRSPRASLGYDKADRPVTVMNPLRKVATMVYDAARGRRGARSTA